MIDSGQEKRVSNPISCVLLAAPKSMALHLTVDSSGGQQRAPQRALPVQWHAHKHSSIPCPLFFFFFSLSLCAANVRRRLEGARENTYTHVYV